MNIGTVTVKTNVTPPITLDPAKKGVGGKLLGLIRPTIDGSVGGMAFHFAPWGEVVDGLGQFVVYGLAGLAIFGAFTLFRRVFK